MPLYDFRCSDGHLNSDVFQPFDAPAPICPKCGGSAEKLPPRVSVAAWGEYVDHRLGEEPVTITSPRHYDQVLEDRNMAVMHDSDKLIKRRKRSIEKTRDLGSAR